MTAATAFKVVTQEICVAGTIFYDITTTGVCLHCRSYRHAVKLYTCELALVVTASPTKFHYITAGGGYILVTLRLIETIAAVCSTEFHT